MQAGNLRDRVAFGRLGIADGEGGNFRGGPFTPQFTFAAKIQPINGGEEVMAGRVQGTRTVLITVRSSSETRSITTDWSARNTRTGEMFNVVEAKDPDGTRHWVELLCQSGTAGGGVPGEQV